MPSPYIINCYADRNQFDVMREAIDSATGIDLTANERPTLTMGGQPVVGG
jgi:hypothetical protein